MTKWAIELSEHHIDYKPRTSIKSQVLADFIIDFSPCSLLQAQNELMTLEENPNGEDFCVEWNIKLTFATPRHPQSNDQAESTNKTIVNTLRKQLEHAKGSWADELPGVLWSYRTTSKTSTGATPFSLAYGSEAVIPIEISIPNVRSQFIEE
ncbi:hypothetical protein UlMin_020615 [Ulmus minor]